MGPPAPVPPPLPPRNLNPVDSAGPPPPTGAGYDSDSDARSELSVPGDLARDPRSSSTQSLVPSLASHESRRTLLLIYIHGFNGNDQSFRSFPAHVHSLLGSLLAESHVIHSKIYPRYKTYRALGVARDNFSAWLEPHESPNTDVILVGHSMGGLLAAEVVLMPNQDPQRRHPFKHRILGTLSLDSPFLGLHPGIVVSGISSLFQPPPGPAEDNRGNSPEGVSDSSLNLTSSVDPQASPGEAESRTGTPLGNRRDPFYDPPFFNDQPFRERPFIKRMMHFASKHRPEGLVTAVRKHLVSHLEFGGCLADYPGLAARYSKLRSLEDVDEARALRQGKPPGTYARVRFVNYYTLSSGKPKTPKPQPGQEEERRSSATGESVLSQETSKPVDGRDVDPPPSYREKDDEPDPGGPPEITLSGENDRELHSSKNPDSPDTHDQLDTDQPPDISRLSMQNLDPTPMADDEHDLPSSLNTDQHGIPADTTQDLPAIPPMPQEPELPNLDAYTDKETRRQAEKESKRLQKAYEQAIKDRAKAVRERARLLERRRIEEDRETQQHVKEAQEEELARQQQQQQQEEASQAASQQPTAPQDAVPAQQPPKRKKFCSLPGKDNGSRDPTWVDVFMDGTDEVGAHCGLFFPGPHYDRLVGDVGDRITGWVQEDMSTRAVQEMS